MSFSIPPQLYRTLRFVKYSFFDRKFLSIYRQLDKYQWLSLDELKYLQLQRIKSLITHANNNSSFYQHRFKSIGLEPNDIKTFEDFHKIPLLTKEDVRTARDKILCNNTRVGRDVILANTGGSTGIPLQFFKEKLNKEVNAALLRSRRWFGWQPGDRTFQVWAKYNELSRKSLLAGHFLFNAFDITDDKLHDAAHFLINFKPYLICGYVSTIVLVTEFFMQHNYTIRPHAVETTAEMLLPQQRELLSRFYQCPIIDLYGCNEIHSMASQCLYNKNLHWFEDIRYPEILDPDTGESVSEGELVVTDLCNYHFPFIRYRTGDVTRFVNDTCSCGRSFQLIEPVKGRTYGTLTTPSGKKIYSHFFTTLFYNRSGVRQFQAIQYSPYQIEFKLVADDNWQDKYREEITIEIQRLMGHNVHVDIKLVDKIESTSQGKRVFIITKSN